MNAETAALKTLMTIACVCVCACTCVCVLSHVRLFATPRTVACQSPLSMKFSRKEYWSGLPFPSPGDLPDPGIGPGYPALQADSLPFFLSHQRSLFQAYIFKSRKMWNKDWGSNSYKDFKWCFLKLSFHYYFFFHFFFIITFMLFIK